MAVAKRQGREKPMKIEQRKVRGLEWGPQVKQTALASPICIGQAQGEEKKRMKRGAKTEPGASLLFASFGSACPHTSRMFFPLLSKWKWAVTRSCNTGCPRAVNTGLSLQLFVVTRQNRGNYILPHTLNSPFTKTIYIHLAALPLWSCLSELSEVLPPWVQSSFCHK